MGVRMYGRNRPGGEGWRRLVRHSYRLGWEWLRSVPRHGSAGARVAGARLLVPLDPWRYYEMSRVLDERTDGDWLDVSSPKLVMSLLQMEQKGHWTGIDLFSKEIRAWRAVDPSLDLRVEDARALSFADESFDGCLCVSVIEHVVGHDDTVVMDEMWRVLRPGGTVILTTNVARTGSERFIADQRYEEASVEVAAGRVFFERHYTAATVRSRLLARPWEILVEEYVHMRKPAVHDRFARLAPVSYLGGFALRWLCPSNFEVIRDPADLAPGEMGVVYLVLRKPLNAAE